ncbi:hypothetical protein [Paraburkholderia sp. J10-1]|uniref:hypothetical protein n=1 Tax=Paraburkholderia sp. J10-1 TaxID=2805430 RepID=UPI002AB667BB|nr:hypothetical protein [Paraburkholderia sp. J10-1]
MANVYKRKQVYYCLGAIYDHGLVFAEAGKHLIETRGRFSVPGMVNLCLATEIFLKSINGMFSNLEDELFHEGVKVYAGRDEDRKLEPGGHGHKLSKLFDGLPADAQAEITANAKVAGFNGDVSKGLELYDKVFVDWRYIYEENNPEVLSTRPLFEIVNAIDAYCRKHRNEVRQVTSDQIESPV